MKFLASTPSPNAPHTPYPQYILKNSCNFGQFYLTTFNAFRGFFLWKNKPIHNPRSQKIHDLDQLYQYSKAVNTASLTPVMSIKHSLDIPEKLAQHGKN